MRLRRPVLRREHRGQHAPDLWSVWFAAPVIVVLGAGAAVEVFRWLDARAVPVAVPGGRPQVDTLDVIKTTLTVLAFMGALLAGLYAYRKQRLAEGDAARADAQQFADRYTKALDQLGSDKAAIRLGGVYAMARLADDWKAQRQTCIDVLCAYLRMPYQPAGTPDHVPGEDEVRKTIVRVIADHLREESATPNWSTHRLDLTGAYLEDVDFGRATFSGDVSFGGATFSGDVRFGSATFSGTAGFEGATFSGEAGFAGATFSSLAGLRGATFSGSAWFGKATFSGRAGFGGATFAGPAGFGKATFAGGVWFGGATFSGATEFDNATFAGPAGFDDATFADAQFIRATFAGPAGFGKATFSRAAWFEGATFSHAAWFEGATFSSLASFRKATFSGSAGFEGATFSKAAVFAECVVSTGSGVTLAGARFEGSLDLGPFDSPDSQASTKVEQP